MAKLFATTSCKYIFSPFKIKVRFVLETEKICIVTEVFAKLLIIIKVCVEYSIRYSVTDRKGDTKFISGFKFISRSAFIAYGHL